MAITSLEKPPIIFGHMAPGRLLWKESLKSDGPPILTKQCFDNYQYEKGR